MSDETVNSQEGPVETLPTETTVNAPEATPADAAIGALATPDAEANSEDSATVSGTGDVPEPAAPTAEPAPTAPAVEPAPTTAAASVSAPAAPVAAPAASRTPAKPGPITGNQSLTTDPANDRNIIRFDGEGVEVERGQRKTRVGKVVSSKMQKTVVVAVETRVRHPLYGKFMRRTAKFKAHDEQNTCGEGDTVEIMETRPISKEKNWRVVRIVEKAK